MMVTASSTDEGAVCEAVRAICRALGVACYEAKDVIEYLLTLTWLESLQYLDEDSLDDIGYVEAFLKFFGETLATVIRGNYSFLIDLGELQVKKLIRGSSSQS